MGQWLLSEKMVVIIHILSTYSQTIHYHHQPRVFSPNIYTRIPIGWCLYDLSMCPLHNIKGHPRVFEDRDGFNNIHSKWLIPARRINIFIFYYYLFSNKCGKSLWHKLVVPIDFYYYHHWYFCSSNTNGRLPLEDTVPLV